MILYNENSALLFSVIIVKSQLLSTHMWHQITGMGNRLNTIDCPQRPRKEVNLQTSRQL